MLTLFSWKLESDIWELIEGYCEKGSKVERSFLRNCIAMFECNIQIDTFLFRDQFANSFLEIGNGILLSTMKPTMTNEVSSEENYKAAF